MSGLDWAICLGYLGLLFGTGWWFARGQRSNEDFFVGGRTMNWVVMGLSLFAASFSSLFFIGLPREAAYQDYHFLLAILLIPLAVVPIVGWIFVPLYHRIGLTSAYEYLQRRFSRPVRLAASLLFCLYLFGWMGDILYVLGVILQTLFRLSDSQTTGVVVGIGLFVTLHTTMGGIKGVIWADVLKALVLGCCIILLLAGTVARVDGGWLAIFQLAQRHDRLNMFDLSLDLSKRNTVAAACAYALFVYLSFYATSQISVQRYVSMPSVAAARRSLAITGLFNLGICLLFFLLGTAIFAFYQQSLPLSAAAGSGFPVLDKKDQLLPYFVQTELPYPGLTGLFLAGLFAAGFSSVDGGINCLTACVLCDWFSGKNLPVRFSRAMSALFGLGVIGSALVVPMFGETVFDIIVKIAGTCFGPLLGVFLLGALVPRANAAGALLGLLAGLVSLALVVTMTTVSPWWYGAVTCLPTLLVGGGLSVCFPPPSLEKTSGLMLWSSADAE